MGCVSRAPLRSVARRAGDRAKEKDGPLRSGWRVSFFETRCNERREIPHSVDSVRNDGWVIEWIGREAGKPKTEV